MALDDQIRDNDEIFISHDVKVIVDDRTLTYLKNAQISYVDENGRSGFKIEPLNPRANTLNCGSGCSC